MAKKYPKKATFRNTIQHLDWGPAYYYKTDIARTLKQTPSVEMTMAIIGMHLPTPCISLPKLAKATGAGDHGSSCAVQFLKAVGLIRTAESVNQVEVFELADLRRDDVAETCYMRIRELRALMAPNKTSTLKPGGKKVSRSYLENNPLPDEHFIQLPSVCKAYYVVDDEDEGALLSVAPQENPRGATQSSATPSSQGALPEGPRGATGSIKGRYQTPQGALLEGSRGATQSSAQTAKHSQTLKHPNKQSDFVAGGGGYSGMRMAEAVEWTEEDERQFQTVYAAYPASKRDGVEKCRRIYVERGVKHKWAINALITLQKAIERKETQARYQKPLSAWLESDCWKPVEDLTTEVKSDKQLAMMFWPNTIDPLKAFTLLREAAHFYLEKYGRRVEPNEVADLRVAQVLCLTPYDVDKAAWRQELDSMPEDWNVWGLDMVSRFGDPVAAAQGDVDDVSDIIKQPKFNVLRKNPGTD